jgi:hypothetical protein
MATATPPRKMRIAAGQLFFPFFDRDPVVVGKIADRFQNKNRSAIGPDLVFNRDHDRDENFQIAD